MNNFRAIVCLLLVGLFSLGLLACESEVSTSAVAPDPASPTEAAAPIPVKDRETPIAALVASPSATFVEPKETPSPPAETASTPVAIPTAAPTVVVAPLPTPTKPITPTLALVPLPTRVGAPVAPPRPTAMRLPTPPASSPQTATPLPTTHTTSDATPAGQRPVFDFPWQKDGLTRVEEVAQDALKKIQRSYPDVGLALLRMQWLDLSDGITKDEVLAIHYFLENARDHGDVFLRLISFPWFSDDDEREQVIFEGNAGYAILRLASVDPSLAHTVMDLPWVADGISGTEYERLNDFADDVSGLNANSAGYAAEPIRQRLAEFLGGGGQEAPVATPVPSQAGRPSAAPTPIPNVPLRDFGWAHDGLTDWEQQALQHIYLLELESPDAARTVLSYSWLSDGISVVDRRPPYSPEVTALNVLSSVAKADPAAAKSMADLPWVADGIDEEVYETGILANISYFADNFAVGNLVKQPWLTDGVDDDEYSALNSIREMVSVDGPMAKRVAEFPWIGNGRAGRTIYDLQSIAKENVSLARLLVGLPWLGDDLTWDESSTIGDINSMVNKGLSRYVMEIVDNPGILGENRTIHSAFFDSLTGLLRSDQERGLRIINQPWFQDGLTEEEEARVVVAADLFKGGLVERDTDLWWNRLAVFDKVLEDGKVRSQVYDRPYGRLHLFVVTPSSSDQLDDNVFQEVRTGIENIEDFMEALGRLPT